METTNPGGRLTLHIGIQRTGTTGLQRALAANRDRLATFGICYPFEKTNHQTIAWRLRRGTMTGAKLAKKLGPYSRFGHIILSGEDFCTHTELDWIEPLRQIYDVDAIVYLRRQDHWLMSWYNQHVKWPFSRRHSIMSPQEFLGAIGEFPWLDFDRMLDPWEEALGRDRVTVRVVEPGQVTDTTSDFLDHLGIDRSALQIDHSLNNDSLPPEMLEFVRRAGMYDLPPAARAAVIRLVQNIARSADCSAKTLYTAAERQGVLDRYEASNSALARRWFDRDRLFLEARPNDDDLYIEGTLGYQGDIDAMIRNEIQALTTGGAGKRADGGCNNKTEEENHDVA
jgi:hypothetical protein